MAHRRGETERTCIVTRVTAPVDTLIRFVVAPDGQVVPDFRRRLPGRGIWVTATAASVETAEKRRLFARAHGGPVAVEPGLAGRVERGLAEAAVSALSLARKAGTVVSGFAKVEAALRHDDVVGLIHAAEAASDGAAKLDRIARARSGGRPIEIIRMFAGSDLDLAFGRANVIHAALLAGPASANLLARIGAWRAFRCDEHDAAPTEPAPAGLDFNLSSVSPGQRSA